MKRTLWLSLALSQGLFIFSLPFILRLSLFLNPIALLVVWGCMTCLTVLLLCLVRKQKITLPLTAVHIVMGIYTVLLLILLFFRPANQQYAQWNLIPFKTILFYFSHNVEFLIAFYNIAASIGLFIPYGLYILLTGRKKSFIQLALIPAAAISSIEMMQFVTHRGSLDIDDFLLNSFGVAIGYLFYPLFKRNVVLKAEGYT